LLHTVTTTILVLVRSETKVLVKIGSVVVFFVLFHTTQMPSTVLLHLMGAFGFHDG